MKRSFSAFKARMLRGAAAVATTMPMLAFADATIDTTAVVAAIVAAGTAVGLIGAAVVAGPVVIKKTFKWISSAI